MLLASWADTCVFVLCVSSYCTLGGVDAGMPITCG
jgi:hypothetical protein